MVSEVRIDLNLVLLGDVVAQHGQGKLDVSFINEGLRKDEQGEDELAAHHSTFDPVLIQFDDHVWPEKQVFLQQNLAETDHFAKVWVPCLLLYL